MNNKPVAWMAGVEGGTMYTNYEYPNSIPLYTHPVKELTDEEIKEVWMKRPANTAEGVIEFARAMLKKASEK